ncbi:unnamed protein product [Rotaria sp. Silwood1]|nr:unnamed protein product [Rotaria sp. Silwood1]
MSEQVITPREHIQRDHRAATPRRKIAFLREPDKANAVHGKISKGTEFEAIINNFRQPPEKPAMETIEKRNSVFMIKPFKFDQSNPDREPTPIFSESVYLDRWDENHVRMPCSRSFKFVYSHDERAYFMSTVLSNICDLALNVDKICSRPPPLLRIGTNLLVTMSQRQAASLLACAFFCLFPFRHDDKPNEAYANFQDPNFKKDNWGQKWCHVVAMDAIYFRNPTVQYQMKCVRRELIKAYASFRPRPAKNASESLFGIATGNWGCGAFNGSKQLKAIIQLMTASEAGRPLVYAAYLDGNLVNSFFDVYQYLLSEEAKVRHLYKYLELYSTRSTQESLFDYILKTKISSLKP